MLQNIQCFATLCPLKYLRCIKVWLWLRLKHCNERRRVYFTNLSDFYACAACKHGQWFELAKCRLLCFGIWIMEVKSCCQSQETVGLRLTCEPRSDWLRILCSWPFIIASNVTLQNSALLSSRSFTVSRWHSHHVIHALMPDLWRLLDVFM